MDQIWVSSSYDFWHQNLYGGYATLIALLIILFYHLFKFSFLYSPSRFRITSRNTSPSPSPSSSSSSSSPTSINVASQPSILEIVSDADLKFLMEKLEEKFNQNEKWENVIDKRNNLVSYNAKCCRPKGGPLTYLSVTVFENCSPEVLRDFYMDNDYRMQWDRTVVDHKQLQVDRTNGTEIGRTIKKFPLMTPREYILAWRLWEGSDGTFYCFVKECEHPLAPLQRKYVRVTYFRSGWHIRKVPGRNACEIKMFHQEDAGLNVEMAKLAFAKGIWSFVCKMDNALRKYTVNSHPQTTPVSAVSLIQKVSTFEKFKQGDGRPCWFFKASVPVGLEAMCSPRSQEPVPVPGYTGEAKEKKLSRRPSKKLVAKGLLLLGGAICLSRGHSTLGAKVAVAYVLTKLHKRGASTSQSGQG